jgi:hypothetical protein
LQSCTRSIVYLPMIGNRVDFEECHIQILNFTFPNKGTGLTREGEACFVLTLILMQSFDP